MWSFDLYLTVGPQQLYLPINKLVTRANFGEQVLAPTGLGADGVE